MVESITQNASAFSAFQWTPRAIAAEMTNASATSIHSPLPMFQAQRAIALLEEAAEKIAFLNRWGEQCIQRAARLSVTWLLNWRCVRCSVTPDLHQHRDELSRFIGDEISRAIAEQRALEKRYEELMTQRAELKVSFVLLRVCELSLVCVQ